MVGLVALLLVFALLFGGVGLFLAGLRWVLIIALVFAVASLFSGFRARQHY